MLMRVFHALEPGSIGSKRLGVEDCDDDMLFGFCPFGYCIAGIAELGAGGRRKPADC